MKNLKQQLIRLGHQNPELRENISSVLDVVCNHKYAGRMELERASNSLQRTKKRWRQLRDVIDKQLDTAQSELDNPIGQGDYARKSYNDAYIRAQTIQQELEDFSDPQSLENKIKGLLRDRKI